ncbi:MAG: hypothetical protein FWC60_02450 [Firmicutes bacterium]|nr:hypothetical protein [Bacillota bacterium]
MKTGLGHQRFQNGALALVNRAAQSLDFKCAVFQLLTPSLSNQLIVTVQCLLKHKARYAKPLTVSDFSKEPKRTVYSRFEVRGSRFETMQCLLIP